MGNRYTCNQTFEEWCNKNSRQDILDLWDYDKNNCLPSEVPSGTKRKMYFKCPNDIHESVAKRILTITDKPDHKLICQQCVYNVDLTGNVFGELTVLGVDNNMEPSGHIKYWTCQCSCGEIISVLETQLKNGKKIKCGGKKHKQRDKETSETLNNIRRSNLYLHYRKMVIQKDNDKCIICGSTQDHEVHHIYPFSSDKQHRFDVSAGACLCKKHHSANVEGGFHNVYGKYNNTPEQFQNYVNEKRQQIGVWDNFDVYEYINSYNDKSISLQNI